MPTSVLEHEARSRSAWHSAPLSCNRFPASARETTPLNACAILLAIVSVAEIGVAALDPRLPAAAVAMAVILLVFAVQRGPDTGTTRIYKAVAPILPILFVPAGVGIFQIGGFTLAIWLVLSLIVGGLTLSVVALIGVLAQRLLPVEYSP